MGINENVKNPDVWTRGLYVVLFGFIYYLLFFLVLVITVFQFLMRLFTTRFNDELLSFSDSLAEYARQILCYIMFKSDDRPYPFSPWPVIDDNIADSQSVQTTTRKKRSRKKATKKTASGNESGSDEAGKSS